MHSELPRQIEPVKDKATQGLVYEVVIEPGTKIQIKIDRTGSG
jgi:hypothetical protein